MSAVLARLLRAPNGAICAKAFIDYENYTRTGLMTEADIVARLVASVRENIPETQASAAAMKGIAAAKRKSS
jgi:hypothetical protein